jgi:uncharacterized protein with HEPN domain
MSRRSIRVALEQMLEYATEAQAIASDVTYESLADDRRSRFALVYALEVVGEAANRVPREDQERYAQIPWSDIIGLRHRLVHGYDTIELEMVWSIVHADLPPLVARLREILSELERG